MLFNSVEFLLFLPVVIALYFALPAKVRWVLLLISSYYFYMCWRAEYALLILFSTGVDYFAARAMAQKVDKKARRPFLYLSLLTNLGLLFLFKYFNFFNDSIRAVFDAASSAGLMTGPSLVRRHRTGRAICDRCVRCTPPLPRRR